MSMKAVIPLGLFLVLAGLFGIGLTLNPSQLDSELIDQPVPSFEIEDFDASAPAFRSEDLVGRTTLLNVFGSWCVACLVEHPKLMELTRDDSLYIVGLNWRDTREKASNWLDRHGDPYDRIGFDEFSFAAIEMGVTGAPETFIIDPEGRIRYKHTGPITDEVWAETLAPIIRKINAEAAPS